MLQIGSDGWLTGRVAELSEHAALMTADEIRSWFRSISQSRRSGDESAELVATAVTAAREAMRRATGNQPTMTAVAAAARGILGSAAPAASASRVDGRSAAALVTYWQAVAGRSVHFVAPDDQAARDVWEFLSPAGRLLGVSAGLVIHSVPAPDRRKAYAADLTVGGHEALVADYLRDQLQVSAADLVQGQLYAAVVQDANEMLAAALSATEITSPRVDFPPHDLNISHLVKTFRRGRDYRLYLDRGVVLSKQAMSRLKVAVGWAATPTLDAVNGAGYVVDAIGRAEGIRALWRTSSIGSDDVAGLPSCLSGLGDIAGWPDVDCCV